MAEGDSIQALLAEGPFNTRAALEATADICVALETHSPTSGGRPLNAASVLLFTDGSTQLHNVDRADSFDVGTLLGHMLLGAQHTGSENSTEAILTLLNANLQKPDIDNAWRRKIVTLVRACRSLDADSRPPLHRVQRRCRDLASGATGLALRNLIKKRTQKTQSWMDLPAANESNESINEVLIQAPEPPQAPPPTPAKTSQSPQGQNPQSRSPQSRNSSHPPPSHPAPWRNLTIAMAIALLLVGGIAANQVIGLESPTAPVNRSPQTRTPDPIGLDLDAGYRLKLLSTPEGAIVTIDGSLIGRTPTEAPGLESGVYQIVLTHGEYSFQQAIMIDQDAQCTWLPEAETPADAWVCGLMPFDQ